MTTRPATPQSWESSSPKALERKRNSQKGIKLDQTRQPGPKGRHNTKEPCLGSRRAGAAWQPSLSFGANVLAPALPDLVREAQSAGTLASLYPSTSRTRLRPRTAAQLDTNQAQLHVYKENFKKSRKNRSQFCVLFQGREKTSFPMGVKDYG